MGKEQPWFWTTTIFLKAFSAFEEMLRNKKSYFFEVHEFEDIIDFYLDSENYAQASQAAEYASGMYPHATSIQVRIAEILIDKGKPLESLRMLNTLEKLESEEYQIPLLKGSAVVMLGKSREAIRQCEKAVSMANEDQGDVLYNIGVAFERVNQYKRALSYFQKALLLEPDNFHLFYDLGYCYERVNDLDNSIRHYEKYLDFDPSQNTCGTFWALSIT
jgi:tetratricopeptide (TPR) repeat protein